MKMKKGELYIQKYIKKDALVNVMPIKIVKLGKEKVWVEDPEIGMTIEMSKDYFERHFEKLES